MTLWKRDHQKKEATKLDAASWRGGPGGIFRGVEYRLAQGPALKRPQSS